jgi:hypothetical protein
MKRLLYSMSALAALAVTAPAAAQYSTPYSSPYSTRDTTRVMTAADFRDRIDQLEFRLNADIQSGAVTAGEERDLRLRIADMRRLLRQYSYNGLSWQESRDLQTRLRDTRQQIRLADNGRYDRYNGYGNWDDRYYGRGGPIETSDACADRGGLQGVFNGLLGRSCYRVGDRVTRNLYQVPSQYRGQYRDNAYTYFRSDGRLIYEIDVNTGRVINSWDMF